MEMWGVRFTKRSRIGHQLLRAVKRRARRFGVGVEHVDLGRAAQARSSRGGRTCSNRPRAADLARLRNDGLGDLHFAQIEVAQRAVLLDAGDADHADVHAELADEIDRRLAHDAVVARAHHAARDDDSLQSGLSARMAATFRLLVITRRP